MWMMLLFVWQSSGRLLSHGSAVLTVSGPRLSWPRRFAFGAAFLPFSLLLALLALGLDPVLAPVAAACGVPGGLADHAGMFLLGLLILANLIRGGLRMGPSLAVTRCRIARCRTGGIWWEVGQFAAAEGDSLSAGRLVRLALSHADAQGIGLVAAARNEQLARAYRRRGFLPDPQYPPALVRKPARAGEEHRCLVR